MRSDKGRMRGTGMGSRLLLAAFFVGWAAGGSAATVAVRSAIVAPGEVVTVPVEITGDVRDVYGFQLDLEVTPSSGAPALTIDAIGKGGAATTLPAIDSHPAPPTGGPVRIGLSTEIPAAGAPRPVFHGPGAIAQVRFSIPAIAVPGQSYALGLSRVFFAGPGNQAIAVSLSGGLHFLG